jgi:hypothetical protein
MTTKNTALKVKTYTILHSISPVFDAYVVILGESVFGFDISMSGAEKVAREWAKSERLGIPAHELTARKVSVRVEYTKPYGVSAVCEDKDGDPVGGGKNWDSRELGEALLHKALLGVAYPARTHGTSWRVEARLMTPSDGMITLAMGELKRDYKFTADPAHAFASGYQGVRGALKHAKVRWP